MNEPTIWPNKDAYWAANAYAAWTLVLTQGQGYTLL